MNRALYKPLGSARELRASLVGAAPPLAIPGALAPDRQAAEAARLPGVIEADLAPASRGERAFGGAFASGALHALLLAGALLWSQSVIDPAPEPIAVEVVVEQPAQTGSARAAEPTAAEAPPPTAPASVAAAPPEAKPTPAADPSPEPSPSSVASPEPTPTPLAIASPEPSPSPPEATPTPLAVASPAPSPSSPETSPTPLAVASPEPVAPPLATVAPTPTPEPTAEGPPAPVATALAEAPPPPAPRAEPRPAKPAEPAKPTARAPAKPKPQTRTALAPRPASAPAPAATTQAFGAAPGARAATAAIGDYRNSIFASISAHTRYPQAALDRRAEGVAKVRFSIDDAGRLTAVALAGSAGDLALDTDAPATVRRSAPFGPPPTGAPHDYVVPIRYRPE